MDFGDVRAIGGGGLRINLNGFLGTIETGYAVPILSKPDDQLKPFYFSIGNYDPSYEL
jgi:hypothetical protein